MNNISDYANGFVIPNQILLSPGVWNGKNYSAEEIERSFKLTNWEDPTVTTLIADHSDDDIEHLPRSVHDWQGQVENIRYEAPNLVGDVRVFDINSINKLSKGKMKAGISVKVSGDNFNDNVCNFSYKNFSLVINPACKDAYIKLSQKEGNEKVFFILNEIKGEPVDSDGLQKIDYKKKKKNHVSENNSELTELKGGKEINKMEEEVKQEIETSEKPQENEEVKSEVVEEVEEVKEVAEEKSEVPEESKPEEKSEESKESEEELSDVEVLKNVVEVLNKRIAAKEPNEMQKLSERVANLEKMFTAKLSEITAKLSAMESPKSTEKLSDDEKPSKTVEKLSAEVGNKFSMNGSSPSKGSIDFASSLMDKHIR